MTRKKPINILIAHCGLEIIPNEIVKHPQCKRSIDLFNNAGRILDVALHNSAISSLENKDQRGRPDILHLDLLLLLNSPLASEKLLNIFFSTQDGIHYRVDPLTRIPRESNRFKGLMFQLLNEKEKHVPKDPPYFIEKVASSFPEFLDLMKETNKPTGISTVLFSVQGETQKLHSFIPKVIEKEESPLLILGGFQKGGFPEIYRKNVKNFVSIYGKGLESWTVLSRIVGPIEREFDVL